MLSLAAWQCSAPAHRLVFAGAVEPRSPWFLQVELWFAKCLQAKSESTYRFAHVCKFGNVWAKTFVSIFDEWPSVQQVRRISDLPNASH